MRFPMSTFFNILAGPDVKFYEVISPQERQGLRKEKDKCHRGN
jgi:hypothetical protein